MYGHPFSICFFFEYIIEPTLFFLTCAWTVVIRIALEAEYFAACAFDAFEVKVVDFDTVSTVYACAELIVAMNGRELFTDEFLIEFYESPFEWEDSL